MIRADWEWEARRLNTDLVLELDHVHRRRIVGDLKLCTGRNIRSLASTCHVERTDDLVTGGTADFTEDIGCSGFATRSVVRGANASAVDTGVVCAIVFVITNDGFRRTGAIVQTGVDGAGVSVVAVCISLTSCVSTELFVVRTAVIEDFAEVVAATFHAVVWLEGAAHVFAAIRLAAAWSVVRCVDTSTVNACVICTVIVVITIDRRSGAGAIVETGVDGTAVCVVAVFVTCTSRRFDAELFKVGAAVIEVHAGFITTTVHAVVW